MTEPINETNWRMILNGLIQNLQKFPNSREKAMVRFYLEELYYRFWHYKLGKECICTDVDFVEYTITNEQPKPLALFEIKTPLSSQIRPGIEPQKQIQVDIAKQLNLPFYRVTFTHDLKTFELERFDIEQPSITLTENEYINFHRKDLRGLE